MEPIDIRLSRGWTTQRHTDQATIVRDDGQSSSVSFVDTPSGQLFAAHHRGADAPSLGVVICPPLLAEAVRNQRRELLLSWELAATGIASARFHYRGMGHSDGAAETTTFDQMVADAVAVGRDFADRSGVTTLGFVGTRLGALVAAAAAAQLGAGPVTLWHPPLDIGRYFNEVFRARTIGLLKRGGKGQSGKSMLQMLEDEGHIDVVGSPLGYPIYKSAIDLDPLELIAALNPRPVHVVQMSVKQEVRPALANFVEQLNRDGGNVTASVIPHDEAWWFGAVVHDGKIETSTDGLGAIEATASFLGEVGMT